MVVKHDYTAVAGTAMVRPRRHEDLACGTELQLENARVMHVTRIKEGSSLSLAVLAQLVQSVASGHCELLEVPDPLWNDARVCQRGQEDHYVCCQLQNDQKHQDCVQ
jgi:hypothetical protein